MCDPVSLAGFAISAASSVVGFMGQQQQAAQQDALYKQNRANALRAFEDKQVATNWRMIQEQESAATEKQDVALQSRAAQASARVAAGEAGVSGLSVDALLGDIVGRTSRYNDRIDQQTDWTVAQLQQEKKGQAAQAVDRINSVPRGTKPSFIDAGLRIGAAGLNAYTDYQKRSRA